MNENPDHPVPALLKAIHELDRCPEYQRMIKAAAALKEKMKQSKEINPAVYVRARKKFMKFGLGLFQKMEKAYSEYAAVALDREDEFIRKNIDDIAAHIEAIRNTHGLKEGMPEGDLGRLAARYVAEKQRDKTRDWIPPLIEALRLSALKRGSVEEKNFHTRA